VTAFMGKAKGNDNVEVRGCLAPLAAVAADTGVAVILVTHFSKPGAGANATAAHRIIGSIAFNAAARSTWVVCRDEEPSQRRLFLPVKWNLCREQTGLAYEINPYDHDQEIPVVHWQSAPVNVKADEALGARATRPSRTRDEVMDWLGDRLAAGPILSEVMSRELEQRGFNERTVWRAKRELGVLSRQLPHGEGKRWFWVLDGKTDKNA